MDAIKGGSAVSYPRPHSGPMRRIHFQLLQGAFSHPAYNDRLYEMRGWCCFEEGVAQVVVAHLAKQGRLGELPAKHATAEACRPKLITLGDDGRSEPHVPKLSPLDLLEDVQRRIERALFTGESDRKNVVQQFQEFSSIISRGVVQRAVKRSANVARASDIQLPSYV